MKCRLKKITGKRFQNRPHFGTGLFIPVLLFFLLSLGLGLNAQEASLRYAVIPESLRPGEPITVAIGGAGALQGGFPHGEIRATLTTAQGRLCRAYFFNCPSQGEEGGFMAALLGVPTSARPGPARVLIENPSGRLAELSFNIEPRDFIAETIELDQANTELRTLQDPRKTAESEHLWSLLNFTGKELYDPGPFSSPVSSTRRTSFFGDRRVFKYSNGSSDTSIHAGIDYGVPRGTAVRACASGKVVLARPRIVTGNSVVIEHLPGVYSLYYHLDAIAVSEGETVQTGSILGTSGSTGLATGPHLHWEIRVAGENTDPDALTARPVLDRNAILAKLYPVNSDS
ncbi:MAG: M23 family metallopeptidase [Treponema sp.]|nr:M23 family metallopeptidase [Treponema sp.]